MDGHVTRNVLKKRQIFIERKPVITRAFPSSLNSMAANYYPSPIFAPFVPLSSMLGPIDKLMTKVEVL